MMRRLVLSLAGSVVCFTFFVSSVHAEYYVVYPAPAVPCCERVYVKHVYHRVVHHKVKPHKKRHYCYKKPKRVYHDPCSRYRPGRYRIDVYYPCCTRHVVSSCGCARSTATYYRRSCCNNGGFYNYVDGYEWVDDRATANDVYPDMNIDN